MDKLENIIINIINKNDICQIKNAISILVKFIIDNVKSLVVTISNSKYIILEHIQQNVYKVMNSSNGNIYIMKKYSKNSDNIDRILIEKEIYEKVKHPLICRCEKIIDDSNYWYIILDYYDKSLFDILKQNFINENIIRFYTAELICALEYFHINGYIHKDIKPENIMIDKNGHIKLIDFNLSCKTNIDISITQYTNKPTFEYTENIFYDDNINFITNICGTIEYLPPEIIVGSRYNSKVDLWMFGILLYELKYKKTPFLDISKLNNNIYDTNKIIECIYNNININRIKFDNTISFELYDLIMRLLVKNPKNRITINEIKNHPFYKNINFNLIMYYKSPLSI